MIPLFSPAKQTTVWDVQTTIRQIDKALYPEIKSSLGSDRTFVYSTLAGCSALLGSAHLNMFTEEIQTFVNEVRPIVEDCFDEIKSCNDLNNSNLKLSLSSKIEKIQFYPERLQFRTFSDKQIVDELQKIIKIGVYTLYKEDPHSTKYYGGRIDISDDLFVHAGHLLEDYGYKQEGDTLGSSFDHKGHITTIEPQELAQSYDATVSSHEQFIKKNSNVVAIKPVGIRLGSPQAGRMSRVVVIAFEVEGLDQYRGALGAMKFSPHLTIFSQEIQPHPALTNVSFFAFTKNRNNKYLVQLNRYALSWQPKKQKWMFTAIAIASLVIIMSFLIVYL